MKKSIRSFALPAMLVVCGSSLASAATGGSMSGSIAEYNAAQVRDSHDQLTIPAFMVTYTANTAIPTGTQFNVTLPNGFEFTTEPYLRSSNATFTLMSDQGGTAKFIVADADVSVGDKILLGVYRVKGAAALEKIIPASNALPLTMQAIGIDPLPLPFNEFASDSGIVATGEGNSLTIDLGSPSNGKQFYGSPDTLTAQLGSMIITDETVDAFGIPVLNPEGNINTLSPKDTATLEFPGVLFGGMNVFASNNAACSTSTWKGKVTAGALVFPDLPINTRFYLCAMGSGTQEVKLLGYPDSETTFSLGTAFLLSSQPGDDFSSSGNVRFVNSYIHICYAVAPPADNRCAPVLLDFFKPTKPE